MKKLLLTLLILTASITSFSQQYYDLDEWTTVKRDPEEGFIYGQKIKTPGTITLIRDRIYIRMKGEDEIKLVQTTNLKLEKQNDDIQLYSFDVYDSDDKRYYEAFFVKMMDGKYINITILSGNSGISFYGIRQSYNN